MGKKNTRTGEDARLLRKLVEENAVRKRVHPDS